ncbi:hypothetical protein [Alicyclobacillus ferrooxydans]|uniref:Uncharacterized protein n=1 Tax=Alicyclobacillus ferrooxydans TaxID=471514 RepID=A0A0P9C9X6_9BACL|nr:hypothetical protein [Alicyclobacillus ferrooxydans]KPV42031.1 hypothetical protein AN477_19880 [Alicyclobacillus ferrooxydans]
MSKGLHFNPEEEAEFQEMVKFHPRGFSEWMGVKADRVANTIWMFFFLLLFSLVSYIFLKPVLNQMLFLSNTYQLVALPVLGIATGLSMLIILRFLFRILLEIRAEFQELKQMHREQRASYKERDEKLNRILERIEGGEHCVSRSRS